MRRFGTQGPVEPEENYVVPRAAEISDSLKRVKEGRSIVIFAPRQTCKTTFFQRALATLGGERSSGATYFPISLNFDIYKNLSVSEFYDCLYEEIREKIEGVFQSCGTSPSETLIDFLENTHLTNHISLRRFFRQLARLVTNQHFVVIIDEFDGIPPASLSDFLHTLRNIYIAGKSRCPHSVGFIGVKSITQLNYDRLFRFSISKMNSTCPTSRWNRCENYWDNRGIL